MDKQILKIVLGVAIVVGLISPDAISSTAEKPLEVLTFEYPRLWGKAACPRTGCLLLSTFPSPYSSNEQSAFPVVPEQLLKEST
jgi:hypothetical protein